MRVPGWLRVSFALFVVGWGANQFTPLLLVYRETDHFSQTLVTEMFAAYALGLVPALLIAARLAGRFGHRAVLRPVMVLSAIASLFLAMGESTPTLLFAGRVLYGVCTGAAMAPGTTWVKELSADAPAGTGARRAAVALSAGFGLGPLVAGFLAEWLPGPKVLPYVVHIAITVAAAALMWNATAGDLDTVSPLGARPTRPPSSGGRVAEERRETTTGPGRHYALSAHFWTRIAPMAVWVFGCPSIAMVILPPLIKAQTAGFTVAFTGIICGLTLGVGVLVQQPARSVEARRPGSISLLGMTATLLAVLLTVAVVERPSVLLVILTAAVFGVGYGLTFVGGLIRVEHASPASELGMSNAVFYSLTYVGFTIPTVVSALDERWPERSIILGVAALAALSLIAAARARRALVTAV